MGRRVRGLILYILLALTTAGAASLAGYLIGMRYWKSAYAARERDRILSNTKSLAVGRPLPGELVLWKLGTMEATYIGDLDIRGGIILYLGQSTQEIVRPLFDSLTAVLGLSPNQRAWVITDFDPSGFAGAAQALENRVRIFWDMAHFFRSEVGLPDAKLYLALDKKGRLVDVGQFGLRGRNCWRSYPDDCRRA